MTYEQAIEVAKKDRDVGISSAIDLLGEMGYDTWSYFFTMCSKNETDDDFDECNIKARDDLYEELGIKEIMDRAYEEVWQ